ncbi:hypothetical protein E2P84_44110 [Burkholderia cepacia]|uniref:Uncharacterized protein n=1 Tax=Burkholderia cepacia TaxID=292 RepID=A0AAX2RRC8_BURCE|nr:hypothetical protein [Burkholderia cepacia]TES60687.1 hypothetical protein E2P84_44110 [Burkholderia cepacia]TET01638.1 hypothetical protein E3D36_16520 [Burkholderia cepacia]TEU47496.1 hypothetical protein E3D37_15950 [Burkholderia cepacia]TEU53523.1 hypothetical protein E3D38_12340 [Burkholderia cepacia]TEV02129.1 hypothetical protein E3D40_13270 [Burkholderia cepacia]
MKVFVTLANAMGGLDFRGAHRTAPEPKAGERVLEVAVIGNQPDPQVVYIAQTYDRSMDVHNFEGVYGDYEPARAASGPRGVALKIEI